MRIRAKEAEGVIERIKVAIQHYNITPEQLFGKPMRSAKANASPSHKPDRPVKFRDENGQTWSGMGKRPRWFVQALEAGVAAESLLVSQVPVTEKKTRGPHKAVTTKQMKNAGEPKYQDLASGKTWTGRGTRPAWFVQGSDIGNDHRVPLDGQALKQPETQVLRTVLTHQCVGPT